MSSGQTDLETCVGKLRLRNPVLAASGTYGSGIEVAPHVDLSLIGGIVTKSVTTRPRRGNPPHRILETAGGMLNSIGLMNPGVGRFIEEVMPAVRELPCARVINVAGESAEDFEALVRTFDDVDGVDAIEMNVSCPNVSGGLDYGADATLLEDVVARCRKVTDRPLWVKLTPNVTDLVALARAGERAGADALSLVNTYRGMAVDWRTRRATLGSETGTGGLSGPAIKPMALLAVHEAAGAVQIPLVGIGGIMTADDVLEFMVTGAVAVQVGTANFRDPAASVRIAADLRGRVHEAGVKRIGDLVGTLRALGNRCG